jgi:uncharacterized protein (UPF0548 family)
MRLVVPASTRSVERALARARDAMPTFDPSRRGVGDGPPYAHDRVEAVVGHGADDLATATRGLRNWATHRIAGVRVFPAGAPVALHGVVLVTFGTVALSIAAPCRVTAVLDERGRSGFTYTTLEGHPEEGEERFEVTLDEVGDVRCILEATSRPADLLLRVTTPANRLVQHHVARGYLRALTREVARPTVPAS